MNKAKYKLGTMVEFTANASKETGTIQGVITREDGFFYEVTPDMTISENDVLAAYRAIAPRKPKAVKTKSSKKTAKTSKHEPEQQAA